MPDVDDLERRHGLQPTDADITERLAALFVRRGEPARARDVVRSCLIARRDSAEPPRPKLLETLFSLPPAPARRWRVLHSLPLQSCLPASVQPRARRVVGSALTGAEARFGGRGLEGSDRCGPRVALALADGLVFHIDVTRATSALLYEPGPRERRRALRHDPLRRQFDVLIDPTGESLAYRDAPGPWRVLWPGDGLARAFEGRLCAAPIGQGDAAKRTGGTWLLGDLEGRLTRLARRGHTLMESRWQPYGRGSIWAVGCGRYLTIAHDYSGLVAFSEFDAALPLSVHEHGAFMHSNVRIGTGGERAVTLGAHRGDDGDRRPALRVHTVREVDAPTTSDDPSIELPVPWIAGWSTEPGLSTAVAWTRDGECFWIDVDDARIEPLRELLPAAPLRCWPDPQRRFALAVYLERLIVLA